MANCFFHAYPWAESNGAEKMCLLCHFPARLPWNRLSGACAFLLRSREFRRHYLRRSAFLLSFASALIATGCGGGSNATGGGGTTPPSNLSYPNPAISATVGAAIAADTPTVNGTVTTYSISPAPPPGLAISSSAGTISGTPTAASAKTSYTVTASNSGGSTAASLTITVNPVAPPSNLSYPQASMQATVGTAIVNDTPTVTGTVSGYTISPALPTGLSIDANSGAISGTPTVASAQTNYTITASNGAGSATAQVLITVLAAPSQLAFLGHAYPLWSLQTDGVHVLSQDTNGISGHWILWDYASANVIASGSGAEIRDTNGIALNGPTAVVWDGSNANIYSTSTGQMVAAVPAPCWYKLASDGSYVVTGSSSALTVFSAAGTQEFSQTGNYCGANVFAAPSQVQVALGAKGNNVIENLAVPTGASTVSPSFNGTFNSWFTDGQRFLSTVSTTVLTYSLNAVQQGIISLSGGAVVEAAQGDWISVVNSGSLSIYAVGSSTPAQTYSIAYAAPSGLELAIINQNSLQMSVIDLSGASPTKTDYTLPSPLVPVAPQYPGAAFGLFAASSASTWLVACNNSVIFDGASINSTPRTLNYGAALSIVAGGNTAAVATESGQILIFYLSVPQAIADIPFSASKLAMSSDGTVLAAGDLDTHGLNPNVALNFYSLPSTNLTSSFQWNTNSPPFLGDFSLSESGTEVGILLLSSLSGNGTAELMHPDGSGNVVLQQSAVQVPLLSPDGTVAAISDQSGSISPVWDNPQTNIYTNGTLTTAVSALAEGWIDSNDFLAANWGTVDEDFGYTGSTIYSAAGAAVSTLTLQQLRPLPTYTNPTFLPGQLLFDPGYGSIQPANAIYSLTTGSVVFQGPSNSSGIGAASASDIVYESTNGVVTIVPFQ
jgi:hypothetical protein